MIVDTNAHLGNWPFRPLPWADDESLVRRLIRNRISVAWVAPFAGIFQKDIREVNRRHVAQCARLNGQFPEIQLNSVGVIHPGLPAWEDDFQDGVDKLQLQAIRLYPSAHGYQLGDPACRRLLHRAAESDIDVQIVVLLEDERIQPPLFRTTPTPLGSLPGIIADEKRLKVQLLNVSGLIPDEILLPLARSRRVYFDFAMVEGVAGVARFAERVGTEQLLFGSNFPLFYPESALLKLFESEFAEDELKRIRGRVEQRLLPRLESNHKSP